jgi:DNA-binding response OmpR family regulator
MNKRILVVEDQEDLRAILRDFLSASAYSAIEAVDGAEGRQHIDRDAQFR